MDTQIEELLPQRYRAIVAAALDVERTQLAAKLARDKLRALGALHVVDVSTHGVKASAAVEAKESAKPKKTKGKQSPVVTAADPFKGRRTGNWRDVPLIKVLQNIKGDVAPNDLYNELGISTSVLRDRVQDIIGKPDDGRRWLKGLGYIVKDKPAWDRERNTLRVDKTKGAAMAALAGGGQSVAKAAGKTTAARQLGPGPTDDEIRAFNAGKVTVAKLMRRYKCGKGKVYRAINTFKVRFGADAPHGEPKLPTNGSSNGIKKSLPNGVKAGQPGVEAAN